MTFKTILVHVGVDPETTTRLETAMTLGARFGASIIGLGAIAWDPYVDPALGYADGETIQLLRDEVDKDIAEAAATFKTVCAGYLHPTEWRSIIDYPAASMTAFSRCADLIVASNRPKGVSESRFAEVTNLVMESGLPVVVAPSGQEPLQPRSVVIGWKNTRESRRAVSDALPFLRIAERVHLVQVCENDAMAAAEVEAAGVAERLRRHGVQAEIHLAPQVCESAAEDLLAIAASRSADMLVLGAYGHSRLREWAFGGVTQDIMAGVSQRVFFSR